MDVSVKRVNMLSRLVLISTIPSSRQVFVVDYEHGEFEIIQICNKYY